MYLYLDESAPIYLLIPFGKSEQDVMRPEEKKAVRKLVAAIKAEWKARKP